MEIGRPLREKRTKAVIVNGVNMTKKDHHSHGAPNKSRHGAGEYFTIDITWNGSRFLISLMNSQFFSFDPFYHVWYHNAQQGIPFIPHHPAIVQPVMTQYGGYVIPTSQFADDDGGQNTVPGVVIPGDGQWSALKTCLVASQPFLYRTAGTGRSKIFRCDECGQVIQRMADLRRHWRTTRQHGGPYFLCVQCDKSFSRQYILDGHQCQGV